MKKIGAVLGIIGLGVFISYKVLERTIKEIKFDWDFEEW